MPSVRLVTLARRFPDPPGRLPVPRRRSISRATSGRSCRTSASSATARPCRRRSSASTTATPPIKKGAIVPGKPAESELLERVLLPDADDERMPPPEAGERLTPDQVAKLKAWIEQGAEYPPHWAFVPPKRPDRAEYQAPSTKPDRRLRPRPTGEGRAEAVAGGRPADAHPPRHARPHRPAADAEGGRGLPEGRVAATPTRRWSTGCSRRRTTASGRPGTGSTSPATPTATATPSTARGRSGRTATGSSTRSTPTCRSTSSRSSNSPATCCRTRRRDQKIATGFHRNTSFNEEGGTDPEQFRVERTVDRANTTAAVWLGLTVGCAQCHDHKYDPVSQKDYYRLYAFFDSCDEPTMPIGGPPDLEDDDREAATRWSSGSRRTAAAARTSPSSRAEIKQVQGKVPTTLVMRERPTPRETYVQIRGDFLRKGDVVQPALPDGDSARRPAGKRLTRLDLAKWLVSRREPADRARHGEPRVAEVLRPRAGRDRERLRHAGQLPDAPGAARLARGRVRGETAAGQLQAAPQAHRDVGDLPAVVRGAARTSPRRTRATCSSAGRRACGSKPRSSATRRCRRAGC